MDYSKMIVEHYIPEHESREYRKLHREYIIKGVYYKTFNNVIKEISLDTVGDRFIRLKEIKEIKPDVPFSRYYKHFLSRGYILT